MGLRLPETFEDVTAVWLNAALADGGLLSVDIESITVEPMHPSKGLIGDLATVHVTYRSGIGPDAFVIKLPAASPDSRQIGDMLQAYAREVAFYRHVAPLSGSTRLPRCFYAGGDHAEDRWVIVLESVDADEFDFFAGATSAQANAAVDALADFHAVWWESETRFDWMPGFDQTGVGGLQSLWLNNLPAFVDRYHESLPGPTAKWTLDFAPRLSEWSVAAAAQPLTLVHSDYRLDNLLFQGDQVTMIDWQTAMRAPAAMDLSCFLATSLDIEIRRRDEDMLIDRYLDRLSEHDVTIDPAWFRHSYDENLLWWMGQFANNLAHLDPDDAAVQSGLTTMVERIYTTGLDHNVGRLLD